LIAALDRRRRRPGRHARLCRPARPPAPFPKGFLWGAATAGHQIEGNNTNSDQWLLENVQPTITGAPSGDAVNSFELWRDDLDLVQGIGLNAYRFSLEWARIEPEPGMFSRHARPLQGDHRWLPCARHGPVVTFNHYTTPRWFAAQGGWTHPQAPISSRVLRPCRAASGRRHGHCPDAERAQSAAPAALCAAAAVHRRAARQSGGGRQGLQHRAVVANTVLPEDVRPSPPR
jgi:beta-glucosidase